MATIPLAVRIISHTAVTAHGLIWIGAISSRGYGAIKVQGKVRGVHRVWYEISIGEIPTGYEVDHQCNNVLCLTHLRAIPRSENRRLGRLYQARVARAHRERLLSDRRRFVA